MKVKSLQLILVVTVAFLAGYYFGITKVKFDWNHYVPQVGIINKEPPSDIKNVDFSMFWTVWRDINTSYYNKKAVDPTRLLDGAISGMVSSLNDPFTMFLPANKNADFKSVMAGQFDGIGAELSMVDKSIIVVAPLDGSPAEKAGIKAGDIITKVNGQSTAGLSLGQAVSEIRGPKGKPVVLTVIHKGSKKASDIRIIRDTITVKSVYGWVKKIKDIDSISQALKNGSAKNDEIAYIRLSQFGDNTNRDWLALVNKLDLQIKKDKNFKGVVLDLRNNPGGYLSDATFIASEFIKSGVVVSEEKGNGEKTNLNVSRHGLLTNVPVAVLINGGSASASEIVAGALRDHKRAILVGEKSFGKGTVQEALDLGNGAGLHLTIAKWLTPNGTWVNKKGLTPDFTVSLNSKDPSHDTQLEKAIEELIK
ncbi:S41 family peptidase [Patescibacteria group bacterium]|nr:S41 family peptidase [Patescibacteria group bacterium]MCL5010088.1 S41 family peptidase [Patescibacteria group bacterium]